MNEDNKIIIYQTADNQTQIDVHMENETVWLTQAQMAELFQKDRTVISRHIRNVFNEGELEKQSTCAKFAHMCNDGLQQYETVMYNLDVIISEATFAKCGTFSSSLAKLSKKWFAPFASNLHNPTFKRA